VRTQNQLLKLYCAKCFQSLPPHIHKASNERQGEVMGVAVSVQSCSEFLPALTLGLIAAFSQVIPLIVAAFFAFFSNLLLISLKRKNEVANKPMNEGIDI
jgi:hypothetical protein